MAGGGGSGGREQAGGGGALLLEFELQQRLQPHPGKGNAASTANSGINRRRKDMVLLRRGHPGH